VECGERLTDVRLIPSLRVDPRLADPTGGFALLRTTVVDRLVAAQSLLPRGLRLVLIEGYRSAERAAGWYCSPAESAPHRTGAAADLTLCDANGAELPMGGAGPADPTGDAPPDAAARANRRILSDAVSAAGLINLPTAWWHWSFGDAYWAVVTGAPAARYGPVDGTAGAPR
jgi:D-alanyl-D-alanine dipeptidase